LIVRSKEGLRYYVLGAAAWVAFMAFIRLGFNSTYEQAAFIAVPFFGVFFLVGLAAARVWVKNLWRYLKLGSVRLVLERAPKVDGAFKGVVEFGSGTSAPLKVQVELACWLETPPKDKEDDPEKEVVLSEKRELVLRAEAGRTRAAFDIAIPHTAISSGEIGGAEGLVDPPAYRWECRLEAPDAGGALTRTFPLEVLHADANVAALEAQAPSPAAAIALVTANLLPLAMVLMGAANAGNLVMLYWAENFVAGFYTVLRMLWAGRGTGSDKAGKTLFFCLHFGIFCLAHGMFVTSMFLTRDQLAAIHAQPQWPAPLFIVQDLVLGAEAVGLFSPSGLLYSLLALFASHGVSFYVHYLRNGHYRESRPDDSFLRPYPRMLLLHVCILGGAALIAKIGATEPLLTALVVGKTLIDLALHRRSHRVG
jgi:hypothetical protein